MQNTVVSLFAQDGRVATDNRHESEIAKHIADQPALTTWLANRVRDVRGTPVTARVIARYLMEAFEGRLEVHTVTEADIERMEFFLHKDAETAQARMTAVVQVDLPDIVAKMTALNLRLGWGGADDETELNLDGDLNVTTDLRQLAHLATFFVCACAVLLNVDFGDRAAA